MEGWMDGWKDGWMDGWMDGRMDGWSELKVILCIFIKYMKLQRLHLFSFENKP